MTKSLYLFATFLFLTCLVSAQDINENAYLLRKAIDKDSIWTVPNTGCYYIAKTGMKENHSGWLQTKELEDKQTDFFYFEAETVGAFQLAFEMNPNTNSINFDTASKINHQLINSFYGYARNGFAKKNNTKDILSGTLSFDRINPNEVVIDGTVYIDTKNPVTYQEIAFKKYATKICTVSEVLVR